MGMVLVRNRRLKGPPSEDDPGKWSCVLKQRTNAPLNQWI
jgi:hypothetical protein